MQDEIQENEESKRGCRTLWKKYSYQTNPVAERDLKRLFHLLRHQLQSFQRCGTNGAIRYRLDPVCSAMPAHLSDIQVMQGIYPFQ